jgi:soluble cytochrome b562
MKVKYLFGIGVAIAILVGVASRQSPETEQNKPEPAEMPFDRMTPAQHLAKAKAILTTDDPLNLSKDQTDEAFRNIKAIPESAPEASEAIALENRSVQAAKEKLQEKLRGKYTYDLEATFRDGGFDIVITDLGDQLILANDLLNDEGNRVQVLATIRKDTQGLCELGFRRVALGGRGVLAGTHIYSLGCRSKK